MNTLILSMPRSQSTRVLQCFAESRTYEAVFDEPGHDAAWFNANQELFPMRSAADFTRVDASLVEGKSVLAKVIPVYPWAPLPALTIQTWREHFQEVIYLKRPLRDVCVSFFVAWKRAEWRRTQERSSTERLVYTPTTDRKVLNTCLINHHAFQLWPTFIPPTATLRIGPELDAWLEARNLRQTRYLPQHDVPYADLVTNFAELDADIQRMLPYSEGFL